LRISGVRRTAVLKEDLRVLGGGLEGDLVAEGPEQGDGSLRAPVGVAPDEEVAAKVLVVAVPS
jgi:hypothetical protein